MYANNSEPNFYFTNKFKTNLLIKDSFESHEVKGIWVFLIYIYTFKCCLHILLLSQLEKNSLRDFWPTMPDFIMYIQHTT